MELRDNLVIIYIHRGAPNDIKAILFSDIVKIKKKFVVLQEIDKMGENTNIPIHRIKYIINKKTQEVIYPKK